MSVSVAEYDKLKANLKLAEHTLASAKGQLQVYETNFRKLLENLKTQGIDLSNREEVMKKVSCLELEAAEIAQEIEKSTKELVTWIGQLQTLVGQ